MKKTSLKQLGLLILLVLVLPLYAVLPFSTALFPITITDSTTVTYLFIAYIIGAFALIALTGVVSWKVIRSTAKGPNSWGSIIGKLLSIVFLALGAFFLILVLLFMLLLFRIALNF